MTEVIKIDGNIREEIGTTSTRRLRRENRLPAVIYGENNKDNIFIDIDIKEFEKHYYKGGVETKIFEIKTDKETFEVVCYQIDLDPVSDRPRHIDFMSVKGKKAKNYVTVLLSAVLILPVLLIQLLPATPAAVLPQASDATGDMTVFIGNIFEDSDFAS